MKMKAAILHNEGLSIENGIEIPSLRSGQVLVEIAYSGICHSQLMEVRGLRGADKYCPHLLGHEGSGIVRAVGSDVQKVQPGDRVILTWLKASGQNELGTVYQKDKTAINAGAVTTLSEYSVVSENRCMKLPKDIPLDVGVLFGCAVPTGVGITCNEVAPEPGSDVAIFGLGGIGLSALMGMALFECRKVIAVDIEDTKLELAQAFGATHIINAATQDPVDIIMEITEGRGVDYSVEAAGITSSIEQAFNSVREKGGLCVFATHPKSGDKIKLDPHALISGKQIKGSWGGGCSPDRDMPKFFKLYQDGKLPMEKLLSHSYCLDEVPKAFDALEKREVTRALITVNPALSEI